MVITNEQVWEARHEADTLPVERIERMMETCTAREKWYAETVARRKSTGEVQLFVNEFYRWSRRNPPSPEERCWLDTPEVMDLQWCRYLRLVLCDGIARRAAAASTPE